MSAASQSNTLPLQQDQDDSAAGDYQILDYPDPIEHGFGIEAVLNDLDHEIESTYRRVFHGWRESVEDPANEPHIVLEDVHHRWDWLHDEYPSHLVLKSKGWKAGKSAQGGELNGQHYEYSFQIMRYDDEGELEPKLRSPVSFQCYLQPQDTDLVLPSGDSLICHYGEGTKIRTQTTYAGPKEALTRTVQVLTAGLRALGYQKPSWETINRESWRVWKGEVHHRIDEELMSVAVQKIRSARTLVEYGGSGDVRGDGEYRDGKHVEEIAVSDMWDRIGFAGYANRSGYNLGLKIYRVGGNPSDERLRHPKLEAFFAGTDSETRLPHADEWTALRATLRQICSTFAIRSGVALADLREDDYYQPMDRDMIDTIVPEGWRRAMKEANELREQRILKATYESLSQAKWDVLWVIQSMNGANYEQLTEKTGYSKDYVREIVRELKELDVLRRRTYPRVIVYHNEELRLNAREKLQEVHPDRSMNDIRDAADDRRDRREQEQQESENETADESSDDVDDLETGDDRDSTTWQLFSEVMLNGKQLGRALQQGYIDDTHVSIRTDPYPELFNDPGG